MKVVILFDQSWTTVMGKIMKKGKAAALLTVFSVKGDQLI